MISPLGTPPRALDEEEEAADADWLALRASTMNATMTHTSSVRETVPSLDEEGVEDDDDDDDENKDDGSHPGKKLSLRLLFFTPSGECAVIVGSRLP